MKRDQQDQRGRQGRTGPAAGRGRPDRRVLAAIALVHTAIALLTWRDLRARTAGEVRGDKRIWRAASAVNTLGSAGYWLFGRRRIPGGREPSA